MFELNFERKIHRCAAHAAAVAVPLERGMHSVNPMYPARERDMIGKYACFSPQFGRREFCNWL